MTQDSLIPCTCKLVIVRDGRTLLSRTKVYVVPDCPHHGIPAPKGKA